MKQFPTKNPSCEFLPIASDRVPWKWDKRDCMLFVGERPTSVPAPLLPLLLHLFFSSSISVTVLLRDAVTGRTSRVCINETKSKKSEARAAGKPQA